jgi:hypothetical protein
MIFYPEMPASLQEHIRRKFSDAEVTIHVSQRSVPVPAGILLLPEIFEAPKTKISDRALPKCHRPRHFHPSSRSQGREEVRSQPQSMLRHADHETQPQINPHDLCGSGSPFVPPNPTGQSNPN